MAKLLSPIDGAFPAENINPANKLEKPFHLKMAAACLGTYNKLPKNAIGARSRDRYRLIRQYAQAMQPIEPYLEKLTPKSDSKDKDLYRLNVSNRICPVIVKPRQQVITLVKNANADYKITFTPIDPLAADELDEQNRALKARVALRQVLTQSRMQQLTHSPTIAKQPGEPDDIEGADIAVLGARHKAAMECEMVVEQVLNGNNYDDIREFNAADLVDFGVAVVKDETVGDKVVTRRVDMRGFVCSPCVQPDFSDMVYGGELLEIPIQRLLADTDGQVTEEEIKIIYESGGRNAEQQVFFGSNIGNWDACLRTGKMQVFDLEFLSTDWDVREERTNKHGNISFGKKRWNSNKLPTSNDPEVKIAQKKVVNLYRCKWVVGTDIAYDFGLAYEQKIDPKDNSRVMPSYRIAGAGVQDMVAVSRTEWLMEFADQVQLRRMKIEHRFNTARPPGYTLDISRLEELAIGPADEFGKQPTMSPKDIIALLITHGVLMYRSESLVDGEKGMGEPLKDLEADMRDIVEYWNDIRNNMEFMNQLLGLNEVTDGSAPDPKRLTVPTQAAVTGTKNALSDLFSADRRLTLAVSEGALIRSQYIMRYPDRAKSFVSSLGSETVAFMGNSPIFDKYRMGVTVEDRPTPEQIQAFEDEMKIALEQGQIDIADVARLRDMPNLKQRQIFLIHRVRKNKEDKQAEAMQMQQQNAQVQTQSAQATSQFKIQEIDRGFDRKEKLSRQEHLQRMDELSLTSMGKNEDSRITATGHTDAAIAQAQGRDATNVRDNTTTLLKEDKGADVPKIQQPADLLKDIKPLTSVQQPIVPGIEQLQQQHFSFLSKPPQGQQQPEPNDNEAQEQGPDSEAPQPPAPPAGQGNPPASADNPQKAQLMGMLSGAE